ncbi:hypothetical protein JCM10450v2_006092 [Rhodotorula kratochvilovae]
MSAKPHKYWPSVGSVYQHWSDLLVATQLGALRAGFSGVSRRWKSDRPNKLKMECAVEPNHRRPTRCTHAVVEATPIDILIPTDAWRVTNLRSIHLEAQRHPAHSGGIGLSTWLKARPSHPTKLRAGDQIIGYRKMHTIEAALRARARSMGRFLSASLMPTQDPQLPPSYALTCVLDTSTCPYFVKFRGLGLSPAGEEMWECAELRSAHTCVSMAKEPTEKLRWRLDFWPVIDLVDGCIGKATPIQPCKKQVGLVSLSDRHIGAFPVRARTAEDPPEAFDRSRASISSAPSASSAADSPDPHLSLRASLSSGESVLAAAEASLARLKTELAAADKLVEVQRKRVEKKRKKLARAAEKARRKKDKVMGGGRTKDKGKKRDEKDVAQARKPVEVLELSDSE